MQVETYLIEGSEAQISDADQLAEYKKYIEDLGLTGQEKLLGTGGTPCPFPAINVRQARILEALFPEKCPPSAYGDDVIPLRVLSVLALAEREQYFDKIYIRYSRKIADPVLIGEKDRVVYMLARWGDALYTWSELEEMALKAKAQEYKARAEEKIVECRMILEAPEAAAERYLNGSWIHI